ncbi:hypothetical protein HU200_047452 [Digitaria exilis]|uniref:Cytochrome P450 n=1 Tax=Digitaria exilis TaxID=1010633 RepID=A0A835EDZ9_9POAL|nr:hypothetical protein HU200_047452 [Digitaria exilis]
MLARHPHKEMQLGGIKYPPGGISKASKDGAGFFPFGWGARNCIGQNFALLEAKIALSMILQRFSFELSPSYTHAPFHLSLLPNSTRRPAMAIGAVLLQQWSLLCLSGALVSLLLWWAWRVLESTWIIPRRLDRALQSQGLPGTVYRFPFGDLREFARQATAARAKPMPLSHDITPRVHRFYHNIIREHGNKPIHRLVIVDDPKLVREIMANKFGHFRKRKHNGLVKRLANGLVSHDGEKWAVHRKIISPAFHLEKLKVKMLPAFAACSNDLITRWVGYVDSDGAKEIDVWPEFQNLTGDVISRSAFGSSFSEGRRIFQLQGIVGKRERAMKEGRANNNDDLLGLLMESNIAETKQAGTSKPIMTMEDIIGELKLFYFAGMDTTAVLLTWTMVVLSVHPEWQDSAREEVLRVFGKNQPDLDGIHQLKIVTMILYEVLRLYPPVVQLDRQTYKEMELGGVTYPAGVVLSLPIVFVHHDKDVWGEDADEFRPERFADGISRASKDAPAFFPFGWGPRICVGQNFALVEAKMALSSILQHFSFGLSPSYTHAPFPVSTLQPDHGAQIMLKKL